MKLIEIVKDIVISILIVICIVVILSVILYDKISLSKVIPESKEYLLSEEMEEAIDNKIPEEIEMVPIQYYIDATDLKKYEKTKEYNKGKKNPFAEYSSTSDNDFTNNTDNSTDTENFYEDDGTK